MIEELVEIAKQAGEAIEAVAKKSFNVTIKKDKTPVTEADMASHDLIEKLLREKFPEIPLLSEENCEIPLSTRKSWDTYFLVDPLDGTKEFIKQNGQYAVLIALMKKNHPIMGIVHSPVTKETWFAQKDKGAYKIDESGKKSKLEIAPFNGGSVNVAVSASHLTNITIEFMNEHFREYETHPIGSAIKFCRIAEGLVDIYPRLGPTSEWDTAAGELILQEAGGDVVQYENHQPLEYNKDSLRNPWFIAFGSALKNFKQD